MEPHHQLYGVLAVVGVLDAGSIPAIWAAAAEAKPNTLAVSFGAPHVACLLRALPTMQGGLGYFQLAGKRAEKSRFCNDLGSQFGLESSK